LEGPTSDPGNKKKGTLKGGKAKTPSRDAPKKELYQTLEKKLAAKKKRAGGNNEFGAALYGSDKNKK